MFGKLKYAFEAVCFVFFSIVFIFSFLDTEDSFIFKIQGVLGIFTVVFSIASLRDKIQPKIQNIVQYLIGVISIIFLSYSLYTYFKCERNCVLLLVFTLVAICIGFLRFVEFVFCVQQHLDYMSIAET